MFVLLILAGVAVNSHIVFAEQGLFPWPTDQLGHLTRVWYIGETFRETGHIPAWFPYWYCGGATYQYYPPLSATLMSVLQVILGNTLWVYKATILLMPAIGGLGAYHVGKRVGGRLCGVLVAAMFAFHPYNLRTLTLDGNFAQATVGILGPYAVLLAMDLIETDSRRSWVLSCITWALMILGHAMCAFVAALGIAVFVVIDCLVKKRASRMVVWGTSVVLGLLLSAIWVIPGVTRLENPEVPYLLPERALAQSLSWWVFNPLYRKVRLYGQYFSLSLTLMSLAVIVRTVSTRRRDRNLVLALAGSLAFCIALSFVSGTPLMKSIPLASQIVPDRVLNYASLPQVLLAGLLLVHLIAGVGTAEKSLIRVGRAVLVTFLIAIVFLDYRPYVRLGGVADFAELRNILSFIPHDRVDPFKQGRLSILAFDWVSAANYFPVMDQIGLLDGWNQEGTTYQELMIEQNMAASYGFWEYHMRNHILRNVRSVIIREDEDDPFVSLLRENGFTSIPTGEEVSLYVSPEPPTYAFDMTNSMLVTGKGSLWAATALPWIARGSEDGILTYDPAYLQQFSAVFLSEPGREEVTEVEKTIRRLLSEGKTVIIDLSNSDLSSLFGVVRRDVSVSGIVTFAGSTGSPFPESTQLDVTRADGAELRGSVYEGLDCVWLTVDGSGDKAAVAGYQTVPEGRVYFVGLGSTRSVIDTGNRSLGDLLRPLFSLSNVRESVAPRAFPIDALEWDHSGLSFTYTSDQAKPVLLSLTHTNRWAITVDGVRTRAYDHEKLSLLLLPAGHHTVTLRYGITWVGILGIAVMVLGTALVIVGAATWQRGLGNLDLVLLQAWKRVSSWLLEPASSSTR